MSACVFFSYLNSRQTSAGSPSDNPPPNQVDQPPEHLPSLAPVVVLVHVPVGHVFEADSLRAASGQQKRRRCTAIIERDDKWGLEYK